LWDNLWIEIWEWDQTKKGVFLNRPIAGPTSEVALPIGKHALNLHSMGTPNGQKITIYLEELNEHKGVEYDAWYVDISKGDQFTSGFVEMNPNSKIPALADRSDPSKPVFVFESASILFYLAEKYGNYLFPKEGPLRTKTLNWVFWQMGSAPYLGGGFGHFYRYAPTKIEYAIDRFAMEVKRELDVLDRHLAHNQFMSGDEYTIADIAIWPWYGCLVLGKLYEAAEFLQVDTYKNVLRWANEIDKRPAVQRGKRVNRAWSPGDVREVHDRSAFEKPPTN